MANKQAALEQAERQMAEAKAFFIAHHRMGPSCHFGPFKTIDEAQAWASDHPEVHGLIIPMYLDVDWNRG